MANFCIVKRDYYSTVWAVLLLFSGNLLALSCEVRFGYDESAASQSAQAETVAKRFGSADVVVLGKVKELGTTKISDFWSSSVRAVVSVERAFKGQVKESIEVYVDSQMKAGQRAVFYATIETPEDVNKRKSALVESGNFRGRESSPNPAFRADGICAHEFRVVRMDAHDGSQELKHLNSMPPAGSGGTLKLTVYASKTNEWLPHQLPVLKRVPVTISTGGRKFTAITDAQGSVKFTKLPPGTYALSVPSISGFKIRCNQFEDYVCAKLIVLDRGFLGVNVEYLGNAFVEIALQTASGVKVDAVAVYKLTRLDAPLAGVAQALRAPRSVLFTTKHDKWGWNERQSHVVVPAGKYRLNLVITQNKAVATNDYRKYQMVEVARQIIKSPALDVVTLREGDNKVVFTLPNSVTPALLTYKTAYPSTEAKGDPNYTLTLVQKDAEGKFGLDINPKGKVSDDNRSVSFTVLSGQTWFASATQYKGDDYQNRLEAKQTMVVKGDATVILKLQKAAH